jgi:hypothetical protein
VRVRRISAVYFGLKRVLRHQIGAVSGCFLAVFRVIFRAGPGFPRRAPERIQCFPFFLDHTTSSAYGFIRVLYGGVILQLSQLGHRILARRKSVVNKLLVAERTLSRKTPT